MTVDDFLASLPFDPREAIAQIDGALQAETFDPHMTAEERVRLVVRRIELLEEVKR